MPLILNSVLFYFCTRAYNIGGNTFSSWHSGTERKEEIELRGNP